jgi:DNA-binding NarL/FixJ family response regulator
MNANGNIVLPARALREINVGAAQQKPVPHGSSGTDIRRVVVVDDSAMTRECFAHVLSARAAELVVEAVAAPSAAAPLRPDLLVINIKSGRIDDVQVLAQVAEARSACGDCPIIAVSDRKDSHMAVAALRMGLRGYVPTSLNTDIVVAAIRLVLAGGSFVPPDLIAGFNDNPIAAPETRPVPSVAQDQPLTAREADVLKQLRQGKPNKVIAYALNISESTVKVHVRSIMKKLHARNRTQVAFLTHDPAAPSADPTIF